MFLSEKLEYLAKLISVETKNWTTYSWDECLTLKQKMEYQAMILWNMLLSILNWTFSQGATFKIRVTGSFL